VTLRKAWGKTDPPDPLLRPRRAPAGSRAALMATALNEDLLSAREPPQVPSPLFRGTGELGTRLRAVRHYRAARRAS
jgi:hypothetical protein